MYTRVAPNASQFFKVYLVILSNCIERKGPILTFQVISSVRQKVQFPIIPKRQAQVLISILQFCLPSSFSCYIDSFRQKYIPTSALENSF